MPLYTFRVTFEDDEAIFRDVQIKPLQTVNDLNHAIATAYKIKNEYSPSLFISNDGWKKVSSLNGISMNGVAATEEPVAKGKAKTPKKKKEEPVVTPKKSVDTSVKLVNIINDPHQKLIAEYEGGSTFAFHIELLSIDVTEDTKKNYPLCSKSIGPSPFQNDDLKKYLDNRAKGEDGEEYALDAEDDETDEMGVVSEDEEGETSEDAAVDPEIADEFSGGDEGFEEPL